MRDKSLGRLSLADLGWQGQAVQSIGREAGEEGHRAD